MNKLLSIILWFVCAQQVAAQQVYIADTNRQVHNLRQYTSVFIDSSNSLTLEDVSNKFADNFKPLSSTTDTAQPYKTYWLRVSIKATAVIQKWWLMLGDTSSAKDPLQNGYIDAWIINNGVVQHQRSGYSVPRSEKIGKVKLENDKILFSGKAEQTQTIYLKIYNEFGYGRIAYMELKNPVVGTAQNDFGTMVYVTSAVAFFFSIMSFFFFFFVREKAYLFFGIYTFLLSLHYLILHPKIPFIDLFIPEHPFLVVPAFYLITSFNLLIFLIFGRNFINLPSLSKKTDVILIWFLRIAFVVVIATSIFMGLMRRNVINENVSLFFFGAVLFFIIRFAFFKTILARFFVAGALWLICFSILGVLWESYLPWLPFNPWPIGQMGQLLIYAAGLAYKVRLNERARAQANRITEMDEIKSRFFANISHEFRTPLTLIQGPLQQIEETVKPKEGTAEVPVRHIKTMRRNTDRLLELVNQLLDLSKLDSGKMKLQIIKGDVLQLMKSLTGSFDSMAERKGIHYHVHFPEQTQIAFFDKDKLEKIVSNLLTNAFKYTPEQGTVSVNVDIEENRLRFSVEDNGPGIPKKELDKIFDRFYQVEGTEDKGSGIGLALVKELVDLYRGQISVSSEPGKGCRFKVSLPIDKSLFKENELVYGEWQAEPSFINKSIEEKEEATSAIKESMQSQLPLLLIVEDNKDLRNFIKETVLQHYQVAEAKNGKEGLEKAIAEVPDIIVSDVMMPIMDGFAMTAKIKKDERTSHIPVILLTAKAGQHHKLEGLETGADDYLIKPFDAKELMMRIRNLLQQRKLLRRKFAGEILMKPSEVAANSTEEIFLTNVMQSIEKNMSEEEFGVEELSKEVAMSRSQLHRKLIALTGQSPSEILRHSRLLRAKELLQKKAGNPSEIAYQVGFNSHSYFSKCFKEEFGVSPGDVH